MLKIIKKSDYLQFKSNKFINIKIEALNRPLKIWKVKTRYLWIKWNKILNKNYESNKNRKIS